MRWLHIGAVVNAALATLVLVAALHPLRDAVSPERLRFMSIAAILELGTALALLHLAGRARGRVAMAGGMLMLLGASVLAALCYLIGLSETHIFDPAIPLSGVLIVAGWLALAFTRPVD